MSDGDDLGPADAFIMADQVEEAADPRPIAMRLVAECEEFQHLKHGEAAILFMFRMEPKDKNGKTVLGEMALPQFMGPLGAIGRWLLAKACGGELPDFLMILDHTFWSNAPMLQRTALVHHELLHADHKRDKDGEPLFTEDGRPRWGIRPHDIEEFNEVVRRYGAWLPDIRSFVTAFSEHG